MAPAKAISTVFLGFQYYRQMVQDAPLRQPTE
jgi:hypothetical protein